LIHIRTPGAEATLLPAGGCIASYRLTSGKTGFDVLRPLAGEVDPQATACFPLLPYSNRIRNRRLRFADKIVAAARITDEHAVGFKAFEKCALALGFAFGIGKMRFDFLICVAEDWRRASRYFFVN